MKMSSKCFVTVAIVLAVSCISESYQDSNGKKENFKSYNSLATLIKTKNLSRYNIASDKDERTFVVPKTLRKVVVPKPRKVKKVPMRRTVQRIIKKSKKTKKLNFRVTRPPTQPTRNEVRQTSPTTKPPQHKKSRKFKSKYIRFPKPFQKLSAKKDYTVHHKYKRSVTRYRRHIDDTKGDIRQKDADISERYGDIIDMDEEDVSRKDTDINRYKRHVDRDLYIHQDFDRNDFLSEENDMNSIKAHVKKSVINTHGS